MGGRHEGSKMLFFISPALNFQVFRSFSVRSYTDRLVAASSKCDAEYREVTSLYYGGAVGAVLIFDITKRQRNYEDMQTRTLSVILKACVLSPPRMARNSLKGRTFLLRGVSS
ncbi:hypothetical protein C5167_027183 [Papaver somniferum]|nr:hypothetical protein C5167_027183 [Papaver somniferum]